VGGSLYPSVDPYLFSLIVTARDGRNAEEIQATLDAEITGCGKGILPRRNWITKKQAKALFAYGTEGVTARRSGWHCRNFLSYTMV